MEPPAFLFHYVTADKRKPGSPRYRFRGLAAAGRSPGDTLGRPGDRLFDGPPSAGDVQVVLHVVDAGGHPAGVDHRVMLGPGPDVAGQPDGVPVGVDGDVAVVGESLSSGMSE